MKILVINSGSSSIKYQLFDMSDHSVLARGLVEQIGEDAGRHAHTMRDNAGVLAETITARRITDHREGIEAIASALEATRAVAGTGHVAGIGHRVVHGGETFHQPTLINAQVIEAIRAQVVLAPLHNPANLLGIEVALQHRPDIPQVAVFDTAFHQTLPPHAFHYALPYALYTEHGVRRYGFHGTSHRYVAGKAAAHLGRPLETLKLIVLHLGNGASAAAIDGGRSIDTSMGMTPLEGLVMGTRCGDLDPAIAFFLSGATGNSNDEIEAVLNKESGLKGICGANDMRAVLERVAAGDERADLAVELYAYRIRKYIGAYAAALGGLDAVVFTAGIGENSAAVRARCCRALGFLGIEIDPGKNDAATPGSVTEIQAVGGRVRVLVVPTDEELQIAEETLECLRRERAG